jgi:tetratricopeptide (TPR) repeat protein
MKKTLAVVFAGSLIFAAAWWALEEEPLPEGPAEIPFGETVRQVMPGPDGEPEVWTLRKRRGDEELPPMLPPEPVLPEPSLRETPSDHATESARALNGMALEEWKHGNIREALDYFEAAIDQDPDDWVPRSDYGRLLVMMTNYAEAGPHLERAAELSPENPRVWLDLLSYYERSLDLELAIEARQRANELAGGQEIVQDQSGLWRLESDSIFP